MTTTDDMTPEDATAPAADHGDVDVETIELDSMVVTRDIRRIRVQITVQRSGVSETLRTKLFIRSTMSGAKVG